MGESQPLITTVMDTRGMNVKGPMTIEPAAQLGIHGKQGMAGHVVSLD